MICLTVTDDALTAVLAGSRARRTQPQQLEVDQREGRDDLLLESGSKWRELFSLRRIQRVALVRHRMQAQPELRVPAPTLELRETGKTCQLHDPRSIGRHRLRHRVPMRCRQSARWSEREDMLDERLLQRISAQMQM